MDLQVRDITTFAENIAVGFRHFRTCLPEHSAEITNLIADLYAMSATLTSIDGLSRQFPRNYARIKADLDMVLSSLKYTLNELTASFRKLEKRPRLEDYRRIWHDMDTYFREQSSYTLKRRLTKYRMLLQELDDMMRNKTTDVRFLAELRGAVMTLLSEQDGRLAASMAGISLGQSDSSATSSSLDPESPLERHGPGKRRSYERTRPGTRPSFFPPMSPSSQDTPPPWVPEVPGSPTSTSATTTTTSNISSAILNDHWARDIFADSGPGTPILAFGESSKCHGEEVEDVKDWLYDEGFDEVAYLAFNEDTAKLSVSFYVRDEDNRARILCKVQKNRRATKYYCLPLNMLEARRVGSSLQLCRRRRAGTELVPWLTLKFQTIEKMVTFFCTFLALRSQDNGRPVQGIRDYELDAEREKFGGLIIDDRYLHALRIYQDRTSGAVRLQASVHEGELERAPIWTAFITDAITSRVWARREGRRVFLRDLKKIVLYPDYIPPKTAYGEHLLKFTSEADARGFIEVIYRLALTD